MKVIILRCVHKMSFKVKVNEKIFNTNLIQILYHDRYKNRDSKISKHYFQLDFKDSFESRNKTLGPII